MNDISILLESIKADKLAYVGYSMHMDGPVFATADVSRDNHLDDFDFQGLVLESEPSKRLRGRFHGDDSTLFDDIEVECNAHQKAVTCGVSERLLQNERGSTKLQRACQKFNREFGSRGCLEAPITLSGQ